MTGRDGAAERTTAVRLQGIQVRATETARNRLLATAVLFAFAFLVMAGRLIDLTAFDHGGGRHPAAAPSRESLGRGDILDRNGQRLATSLPVASLYADPKEVLDAPGAVKALRTLFPDLDPRAILDRLGNGGRFVWIRRGLSPDEQRRVIELGLPGFAFRTEYRRFYPFGAATAHIVGFTDVDGRGIAGIEGSFEKSLSQGEKTWLSLDMRVQHILRHELEVARREFNAIGAAGMVLDANTGEVIAMVSLPDFDPQKPGEAIEDARFNRVTKGVYEMGSTFKLFTLATAFDVGATSLNRSYDATHPLRVANHTISDYHATNRWLSTADVLIHSSNIGAALMALDVGTSKQRDYMRRFGLLNTSSIELPETGAPLVPSPWREINTMTVAFGHGIAVTPLHLASGVATIVNGGVMRPVTILMQDPAVAPSGTPVLSPRTSKVMRDLMRLVVTKGTGAKAEVAGYEVGGKTGTAEKLVRGRYQTNARIASFIGAFPMTAPRYVVLAMLDEPKGNKSTYNYATGGWVAAPVVGRVVRQMAPLLGIPPQEGGDGVVAQERTKPTAPTPPAKPTLVATRKPTTTAQAKQLAAN